MSSERWRAVQHAKALRRQDRERAEAPFNAEIRRRIDAGETKDAIIISLGISRELFNRVKFSRRDAGRSTG